MSDTDLDRRIRAHFERAAAAEAPDFEAMLTSAQSASPRRRARAWIGAAAAAAIAAAVIVTIDRRDSSVDDAALMAELSASTHWSAPSDVLLADIDGSAYLGLPKFNDLRYRMQEVKPWI